MKHGVQSLGDGARCRRRQQVPGSPVSGLPANTSRYGAGPGKVVLVEMLSSVYFRPKQLKMVWPFTSWSSEDPEKPEERRLVEGCLPLVKLRNIRSGYECAPYTIVETTEAYQVSNSYLTFDFLTNFLVCSN